MSGLIDTNIVVRYLTGRPAHLASSAAEIIESDEVLQLTDVVLAEIAYVLTSTYRMSREEVVDSLMALLQRHNVEPFRLDKGLVLQALLLCRPSGRISYPDALIWAATRSSDEKVVYTQDARFPSDGIEVRSGLL